MSRRAPTPEQEAAIVASGRRVLVEAGAGTGKTGTMVERYCRLVCEEALSLDAVLAFTFTDRAAAELRERIRAELGRRAEDGSERAQELLAGIGGAWVTTIHGFCNRLLAGHPVAAGVDPGFRVLDAPEAARISAEAFEAALEDFLAPGGDARERTLAAYGIGGLRAIVAGAHAELRSRGLAAPRLPEPPEPDVEGALRRAAGAAAEALAEAKPANSSRELLERAAEALAPAGGARPSLDELAGLRSAGSSKAMAPYREAIEAAAARTAEAGEGGETYRHLAELLELFSIRFAAAKERRAGLDFEDLQILAVELLEGSELGAAYRERFGQILVDEFQDTNRLQLRLIEALHGPRCELMVVGDELQSIYGFRHADLEVFREQRAEIAADPDSEALALSGNFRSRPALVGAVNAIGERLLGDAYRPLRVGAAPGDPRAGGGGVELLLTGRDGWDAAEVDLEPGVDARTAPSALAEARFLAARLRELADGGVERGSMVVLLRAFTNLDAHEDSLERAGLRPYVVGGRGYWSQQQVGDVCALLATIANPLDDQALFGALASPACGVSPDTLWLLRSAAGARRRVWPAVERIAGRGAAELEEPEALARIPAAELERLRRFAAAHAELRRRAPRLPLAELIDAALAATGYDLAVLMRPAGEARFANVRKLMRLAAEFESREGRDLRGLLDFLAARSEADADAQAATAIEGHDGVRIMTVHSAKGLEFDVVAVPDLARSLLAGSGTPLLPIGRQGAAARVGLQLRRLGAASINLYSYAELREEGRRRDAEEELRLFHVAATRARERLLLSGVVKPEPGTETTLRTPVIERIVEAFGIDRESDSSFAVPAPEPRPGLEARFEPEPAEIAVRVNLASPERAAGLTARRSEPTAAADLGSGGPAPLVERRPPAVPNRPLSYTAIGAYEACPYRFYTERVLDLGGGRLAAGDLDPAGVGQKSTTANLRRGAAVHSLLEWSQANGWREPSEDVAVRHAVAAGLDAADPTLHDDLLGPVRAWLASALLERVRRDGATVRAEAPLLLDLAGTVLRGSIDLLVERAEEAPLVVDYKTDRLDGAAPAERARRYEAQRDVYALAVAAARAAPAVEVAYVFLERPDEPALATLGPAEMKAGRRRLQATIERIAAGEFAPAPPERRGWELCDGCPALGRLCSGPL